VHKYAVNISLAASTLRARHFEKYEAFKADFTGPMI